MEINIHLIEVIISVSVFVITVGGVLWRFSSQLQKMKSDIDALKAEERETKKEISVIETGKEDLVGLYQLVDKKLDVLITKFDIVINTHTSDIEMLKKKADEHATCYYYNLQKREKTTK